jgi:hypothetical protein
MKAAIIFFNLLLMASSSWSTDEAKSNKLKSIKFVYDLVESYIERISYYKGELKDCSYEHYIIGGNDWFFTSNKKLVLKLEDGATIPIQKWRKYNCEIIPEFCPIFAPKIPNKQYTWQAEVWLELKPLDREIEEDEDTKKTINNKIAEYRLCIKNIQKEVKEWAKNFNAGSEEEKLCAEILKIPTEDKR